MRIKNDSPDCPSLFIFLLSGAFIPAGMINGSDARARARDGFLVFSADKRREGWRRRRRRREAREKKERVYTRYYRSRALAMGQFWLRAEVRSSAAAKPLRCAFIYVFKPSSDTFFSVSFSFQTIYVYGGKDRIGRKKRRPPPLECVFYGGFMLTRARANATLRSFKLRRRRAYITRSAERDLPRHYW